MQLIELQEQWHRLDEKLERIVKIDDELLREAVVRAAQHHATRLTFWPALDITFCVFVLLLAGSFVEKHLYTWALIVPAGVMMSGAILLLNSSVRQLILVSEIDWSGTVVNIQSSLSRLRIVKILQFKWTILLSPLVGFCGLIVGLQWLLDQLPESHSISDKLNTWWLAGNYAFGLLFIPFGQVVVGFLATRYRGRAWWQRAIADISGSSIERTKQELERWACLDDKVSIDAEYASG
jgi:hypothetical protein